MPTYLHRRFLCAALIIVARCWLAPTDASAQVTTPRDSILLRDLRAVALSSSSLLDARRAAVAAAEARVAATGLLGPAVLSAEIDEVPGANVGAASVRLDVSREVGSKRRATAARDVARTVLRSHALRSTQPSDLSRQG